MTTPNDDKRMTVQLYLVEELHNTKIKKLAQMKNLSKNCTQQLCVMVRYLWTWLDIALFSIQHLHLWQDYLPKHLDLCHQIQHLRPADRNKQSRAEFSTWFKKKTDISWHTSSNFFDCCCCSTLQLSLSLKMTLLKSVSGMRQKGPLLLTKEGR